MKLLVLLFLCGVAAATVLEDAWGRERDKVVAEFMKGMKMAGSLQKAVGMPDNREFNEVEDEIKTELGKQLKEALDQILEKIKVAVDKGKTVHKELVDKAKEIVEKLKDLHISVGEKAKELIEKLKDKTKELLKKLWEKILGERRRSIQQAAEEINLEKILEKVVEMLREKFNINKAKEYIKEKYEKVGDMARMMDLLEEDEMREAIVDFMKKSLNNDKRSVRSLKESWEELKKRIKDFFKDKHIELKEKFSAFYEWLEESIHKGLEIAKDRTQALKNIAREFIKYYKEVRKEVALEALEALKPYKGDLGDLWEEFVQKVKEVLHKED